MSKYITQHRRGTTAQWVTHSTLVPYAGEIVIEDCGNGLKKLYVGDGTTTFANLRAFSNTSFTSITPLIASSVSDMTDTTKLYVLTSSSHVYAYSNNAWVDTGMSYTGASVVQTTGTDTFSVMSQNAVTDAITYATASFTSVALFSTLGVIGDSLSSGGVTNTAGTGIIDCYPISWAQILGRKNGITVKNYASTSADISSFLNTTENWGMTQLETDAAKDCYIIYLGTNAEKSLTDSAVEVGVGTTADINTSDYTQNADTFCGHYGRVISRILVHSSSAKIILVIPRGYYTLDKGIAIRNIATLFSIPFISLSDDSFYSTSFYSDNLQISHPTAPVYAGMALAFERQIVKCIKDNMTYFNNYRPQLT